MKNYYIHIEGFMIHNLQLLGAELLVYAIYYSYYIASDRPCFISTKRLAEMTGYSERAVRLSKANLVGRGLLNEMNYDSQKLLAVNGSMIEGVAKIADGVAKIADSSKKVTKEINKDKSISEEELNKLIEIAKTPWLEK